MVDMGTLLLVGLIMAILAGMAGYWYWTHRQRKQEDRVAPDYVSDQLPPDAPTNIPPQRWLPAWACPQEWMVEVGTCGDVSATGKAAFVGGYSYKCVQGEKRELISESADNCFTFAPVGGGNSTDPFAAYTFTDTAALTHPSNLNLIIDDLTYHEDGQVHAAYPQPRGTCPADTLNLHYLSDPAHSIAGTYSSSRIGAKDFLNRAKLTYQPPGVAGNETVLLSSGLGFLCPGDDKGPVACHWFDTIPNLAVSCLGTDAALPCADATAWNACVTAAFARHGAQKPTFAANAPHSTFTTTKALMGTGTGTTRELLTDLQDCNVTAVGVWNSRHLPTNCQLRGHGADECARTLPAQMRPQVLQVLANDTWHMVHTLEHGFAVYPTSLSKDGTGGILTRSTAEAVDRPNELTLTIPDQLPKSAQWTSHPQADFSPYFAALPVPATTTSETQPWVQLVRCT